MSQPRRPVLAAEDDLSGRPDINIDRVLDEFIEQRTRSPIVRPSRAGDVQALLDDSFPAGGDSLAELVAQIARASDAYPRRNTHPGFFGWITTTGLPSDPLAHAISAALNQNLGGYWTSPFGATLERCVIGWLAELAGLPAAAEGILLSGGSMANMTGIACALARCLGPAFRERGLRAIDTEANPVIICSSAAHFSIRRAAVMLGIGTDNIVSLEADADFRMPPDALAAALQRYPTVICVAASAGTTNTGAIDPLDEIAELCARHDVWLHVDAAYGGAGLMSPELKPRYRGIERADSIVMDMHKWFFQSLDGSLLLYRDAAWARQLFFETSDYLQSSHTDEPEQYKFFHLAPELSRRFRALPIYIALRHYGIPRLGRNVLHHVRCAEYLAALIQQQDDLELVVAPQLAVVCFRYRPAGLADAAVDRINRGIRDRIELEGEYLMSASVIHARPVLRVSIMNPATRAAQLEGLLERILQLGASLQ